jgi:hypothetical protein
MLSKNEPKKVHGSVTRPPISIAATAIPAGGKTGDAYPGDTASSIASLPVVV